MKKLLLLASLISVQSVGAKEAVSKVDVKRKPATSGAFYCDALIDFDSVENRLNALCNPTMPFSVFKGENRYNFCCIAR